MFLCGRVIFCADVVWCEGVVLGVVCWESGRPVYAGIVLCLHWWVMVFWGGLILFSRCESG